MSSFLILCVLAPIALGFMLAVWWLRDRPPGEGTTWDDEDWFI